MCCVLTALTYKGKSLNNRNFILNCMEKYAQRKILFRDTKWLLSNMSCWGRDDQAVWDCALGRTIWPLHCQLAPWKSNEALFVFCGQRVWNLLKSTEEGRFSMERVAWVRRECRNGWEKFQNGRQNVSVEHRSGRPVSVASETVKEQVELFSREHPQACGQVDQVCWVAGGLYRKIRHRIFCKKLL